MPHWRPSSRAVLVIAGHQSIGAGIALAIPLAAAAVYLTIIVRTITAAFQHAADKAVENGKLTAPPRCTFLLLFLQANVSIPESGYRCYPS